jgi:hypothetical protein
MPKLEQRWRPMALMPAFKFAISSAAETSRVQAEHMRLAISQPDSIHRFELTRMRLTYEDTAMNIKMCREQVRRWRSEHPTPEQMAALDQLAEVIEQWGRDTKLVIDAVKTLLHEE